MPEKKENVCYFHRNVGMARTGHEILRLTCPQCDRFEVVECCKDCANAIRTRSQPDSCAPTTVCDKCSALVKCPEAWTLIGAA